MLDADILLNLPTADQLPDSDDTPVDNEIQYDIPALLKLILGDIWRDRQDWFFAGDMGIYYNTQNPRVPIVPDCFLSLGVPRLTSDRGRKSYVLWQEDFIAPILVMEIVSHSYNDEYERKLEIYAQMGALYYVIYNPNFWQRDKHDPFEVYKLQDGTYIKLQGDPIWMPEIGLGIGRDLGNFGGWHREWLYWFNESGRKYASPDEKANQLSEKLRELGIDPDSL